MSPPAAPVHRRVVAIVPAKDRADTVGATVAALVGLAEVDEVLVVDDGSTDATADAARRAGAWVLRLPANRGKGGAVAAAVAATGETDVYLLVDADTGVSAAAAGALLDPVLAGEADMAVGVLPGAGGRGGFGLVRRLAGAGIRVGTGGFRSQAPLSGQRAVSGPLLRSLALAPRFGLEVGLTVDAVRAGARVLEMPVAMDHRHTGRTLAGFRHRARQGADVSRALWPRLAAARSRVAAAVVVLLVAMAAATWSAGRAAPAAVASAASATKVVLVGAPGLSWGDVGAGTMPNLDRLVADGAVAAMNVRTRSSRPSVGEGYATLGAGSRVRAGEGADVAVSRGGAVVVPSANELRAQAGSHLASLPGALGDALHAAGRRTAVVGNADLAPGLSGPSPTGHPNLSRPAAVALMDRVGSVDGGVVAPEDLLLASDLAPYRHTANIDVVTARTLTTLNQADVVLVDPGDLDRAQAVTELGASAFYVDRSRAAALAGVDDLLGRLRAELPPGTLLLVVSVTPPGSQWRLTPMVAWGAGVVPGYLESPSTHRTGLVTLTDVAPTVLAALGAPVPDALTGGALRYVPGAADVSRLARLDRDATWRARLWLPATIAFGLVEVVVWLVVGLALAGRAPWARRSWLRAAAVGIAAVPLAALAVRALPFVPAMGAAGLLVLVAVDVVLAALALRARCHPLAPLGGILGATVAVLLVDVATGARLQLNGLLGYSPQTASRFFGLGNTTFGVLAAATVLVAALHVDRAPRPREALVGAGALFLLVAFVDGAPFLGADVGGLISLAPAFGLTWVALAGRRLTWRAVGLAGLGTAGVLGAATVVDLLRPPSARTHLGRLASDTLHHGPGGLLATVARKVQANVGGVGQATWIVAGAVVVAVLVLGLTRTDWARRCLPAGSTLRIGVLGALAACLLGFALNDSGAVVVGMGLGEIGPFVILLALAERPGRPALLEPAPEPVGIAGG